MHNNIQGRRKIGKLSLMLRELIYSSTSSVLFSTQMDFTVSLKFSTDVLISLSCLLDSLCFLVSKAGNEDRFPFSIEIQGVGKLLN